MTLTIDGGLRILFRQNLPVFHWQSIESGLTGGGIPDSNYCVDEKEGWIEFKLTGSRKVGLKPDQVGWALRRARAGGRTFIAVRFQHSGGPRLGSPMDSLYLFPGSKAKEIALQGLSTPYLGRWEGGPTRWDWQKVGQLLRN